MNEKLLEFFNAFKHLRSMQTIVEEILMLDYYVDNFDGSLNIASNVDESLASSTKSLVKKGDINKDSVVNLLDLCALLKIIGKNPVDISTYDVNNDGVVNIKDAETMMSIIFK